MPTEVAEPQTTSSLPTKSFMDSPEFTNSIEEALKADAATRGPDKNQPAAIAPVTEQPKPIETPTPTQTTTAPKPAAKDSDEIPDDIKSPAAQSSWKKLKESKAAVEKERDDFRTKHDTLSKRIAEMEKAAKTPAQQAKLEDSTEYQQLKALAESREKQLDEYSERLRLVEVEQHPKFQAYFKGKIDQQMAMAKNVGGDKALEVLKLPPGEYRNSQLEELAGELSPMKAAQLATVLTRLDEIEAERAGEIAQARANYATIQAEQKQQSERQRQEVEKTFERVTQEVTGADGLSVFQEREGDEEWNKGVQERRALAQHAFSGQLKPEGAARAAYWAAAAPAFLVELKGALEKNAELEKQIAELRAVAPSPGGERPGAAVTEQPSGKKGLDALMEDLERVMPGR